MDAWSLQLTTNVGVSKNAKMISKWSQSGKFREGCNRLQTPLDRQATVYQMQEMLTRNHEEHTKNLVRETSDFGTLGELLEFQGNSRQLGLSFHLYVSIAQQSCDREV